MKLSKAQRNVLQLMADGWALGKSTTFQGGYWLQKNGLGKGGPFESVNANTATSLIYKGLVSAGPYNFPTQPYTLTDSGRDALENGND